MRTSVWRWLRAVVASVALAGTLALALAAAPAFGATLAAAHSTPAL